MNEAEYMPEDDAMPSVLFISPDTEAVQSCIDLLKENGLDCTHQLEVLEGIELARHLLPDAIVIDEKISSITALEAGKILKSKLPYIPIILWAHDPNDEGVRHCLESSGYDLCICKSNHPLFFLSQLRALLRNTSQLKQLMEANRRLNRLSVSDPLTGLFNHKHLLDWLHIEFKRSERNLEPLSCIMIDIDHFKSINDTYGHKFGDFVLKEFAQIIASNIRKIDILGRYGGEEFLVILPNTDLFGAINLAEKLRKVVERYTFKDSQFEIGLTASLGVSSTSDDRILRADHLLQMTDKALYIGKESGRNRVCTPDEVRPASDEVYVRPSEGGFDIQGHVLHMLSPTAPRLDQLTECLVNSGFRVIHSKSEEDLLEKIRRFPCDILIMDRAVPPEERDSLMQKLQTPHQRRRVEVILLADEAEMAADTSPGQPGDNQIRRLSESQLVPVLKLMIMIRNLQADLRESNTRLNIAQRKLIRSERLKALGEMSSGVAHDLNNILGIILGRAQYLKTKSDQEAFQKGLEIIEKSALDGAQTLRRILEFFRPELPINVEALRLQDTIRHCLEFTKVRWRDEANLKGLQFHLEVDVPDDLYVLGSDPELCEVFTNLIFNALDAMPEGGTLSIAAELSTADEICISVQDTGIGMARTVLDKVFDPFFTTKHDKGTGLGMSIVASIISRHGGRIEVTSKEGIGTTFLIYLPKCEPGHDEIIETEGEAALEESTADEIEQVSEESEQEARRAPAMRILLVDDEENILQVFEDILSESGYEVDKATHGHDALNLFRKSPHDVVITDLGMPDVSGWDVASGVKEIHPDCNVVLTSGWGEDYERDLLDSRGVDYVLPKPVGVKSLLDLMLKIQKTRREKTSAP